MPEALPYPFHHLPRLTRAQVAVQQSVLAHLGARGPGEAACHAAASAAEALLGATCQVAPGGQNAIDAAAVVAGGADPGCFVALAAAPGPHHVLCELDPELAAEAATRLLGGDGTDVAPRRALTDIEAGVLSFMLLRVLSAVGQQFAPGAALGLTLERLAARPAQLGEWVQAQGGYQCCGFTVTLGERRGFARLYLPDILVTERFGSPPAQGGPGDHAAMRAALAALGETTVQARLTASKLDLSPADLEGVEAGDIIVLENHQLALTSDGIEGEVFVTLGRGRNGGFAAQLRNDESQAEQASLEVTRIVVTEQPAEADMAADEQDDNLAETEGLLRDVDAPVAVELGRLRLSTAQVIRLRAGQVLRLTRGPTDPVDLVVGDKVFARGELIEVEGELGVRLTQVAGRE